MSSSLGRFSLIVRLAPIQFETDIEWSSVFGAIFVTVLLRVPSNLGSTQNSDCTTSIAAKARPTSQYGNVLRMSA